MKTQESKFAVRENAKAGFFKTVLDDKRKMHDYVRKCGSLDGYKSDNFEFAKPLSY
jgi:hypothetical protein